MVLKGNTCMYSVLPAVGLGALLVLLLAGLGADLLSREALEPALLLGWNGLSELVSLIGTVIQTIGSWLPRLPELPTPPPAPPPEPSSDDNPWHPLFPLGWAEPLGMF